ncbi:MAG: BON domain-containing protein [Bryobacterales bacterium]|nr:BON domain-containing protein [Bryobacterales bacterium]
MTREAAVPFLVLLVLLTGIAGAFADDKQVSDDAIFDNVRRRLASDPEVKGGALEVEVRQGVVTLRGAVETDKQIKRAEKLTKKVDGVKSVVNELKARRKNAR